MKIIISESRLKKSLFKYFDSLFDNIHLSHPYDYNQETGEEYELNSAIEFYLGDKGDDDTCFRWYSCEYFNPDSYVRNICPTVSLEYKYENLLNGYFGEHWKQPFKEWFISKFGLNVKTIDQ